jgi:hypothetical protein
MLRRQTTEEQAVSADHATLDATLAAAGSKATYTGASASVVAWFLSSEFGMLAGLGIGIVGLGVNWFYKHKEDKRRQAEHDKRMRDED